MGVLAWSGHHGIGWQNTSGGLILTLPPGHSVLKTGTWIEERIRGSRRQSVSAGTAGPTRFDMPTLMRSNCGGRRTWIVIAVVGLAVIIGWSVVGHAQDPKKPGEPQTKTPAAKKKSAPQEASDFESRSGTFFYQPPAIANLAWSPDGTLLATVGSSPGRASEITIWNARIAKVVYIVTDVAGTQCVRFSPDGKQVVVGNSQGRIRVFEAATGKPLASATEKGHGVLGMAFAPDGSLLATAGADSTAILWETATWKKGQTLRGHGGRVLDVAFSKDRARLVTTSADRTAKLWDIAAAKAVATLPGTAEVTCAAISRDGRLIATATGATAKVWDANTGDPKYSIDQVGAAVGGLSFSPDSSGLLAACADGRVRMWDSVDGEALATVTIEDATPPGESLQPGVAGLRQQAQAPQAVVLAAIEFGPDGKYFATGGSDRTVRIHDADSHEVVQTLNRDPAETRQPTPILAMAVSPDRKWLGRRDGGRARLAFTTRPPESSASV